MRGLKLIRVGHTVNELCSLSELVRRRVGHSVNNKRETSSLNELVRLIFSLPLVHSVNTLKVLPPAGAISGGALRA